MTKFTLIKQDSSCYSIENENKENIGVFNKKSNMAVLTGNIILLVSSKEDLLKRLESYIEDNDIKCLKLWVDREYNKPRHGAFSIKFDGKYEMWQKNKESMVKFKEWYNTHATNYTEAAFPKIRGKYPNYEFY